MLEDLFRLEDIGDVALSPDGKMVAYVQRRPLTSAKVVNLWVWMQGNDRADVWLAQVTGGSPTRITDGVLDGSGFFEPKWSPDGAHIAMLSTRGNNIQLWVWEKVTGRLMRMSDHDIARDTVVAPSSFGWVDEHRIAAIFLPQGEPPQAFKVQRAGALATREWQKAWLGKESTASTLESGVPADLSSRPQRQAVVFTLGKKEPQLVGTGVGLQNLQSSSDGQYIEFIREIVRKRPGSDYEPVDKRIGFYFARYQLTISSVDGRNVFEKAPGVDFVVYDSFHWARSGHRFAFLGTRAGEDDGPVRLFCGEVGSAVSEVALPGLDPKSILWLDGEKLLVAAESNQRTDLWLVRPDKAPVNLTSTMRTPPSDLHLAGRFAVGLADGELWKLDLTYMTWTKLEIALNSKVSATTSTHTDPDISSIIVESSNDVKSYYKLDLNTDRLIALTKPSAQATLVAYSSIRDASVFADVMTSSSVGRSSRSLSIVQQGQPARFIVRLNGFLNEIVEGETRSFKYRGSDGQELIGWLILPPQYNAGRRLPMLTWVYPNESRQNPEQVLGALKYSFLDLRLLASRGYAVLLPSMPMPSAESKTGWDMGLELTKGVLPAIDKVIEMGIADPNRVALMGHSWGGYSTYSLITQTNRFKAAVAIAGFSDLISMYDSVNSLHRYLPYIDEYPVLYGQGLLEGSYRMNNPPWKDLGRYLRNSPITDVDRVQTPLLLIHGDLDSVPIQQAEEFFNALYRQGKRARFVRYWGEWHYIESPANIRNMWQQIYAWLDEFCDISRDDSGNIIIDGDHVKSRNGAPALKPADFARFEQLIGNQSQWKSQNFRSSQ